MTTYTQARHGLRFGGQTATLSAGLLALAMGAPIAAQAELAHRLDVGEPVSATPLMDDCSLRAPCSDVAREVARRNTQVTSEADTAPDADRSIRVSDTADRNVARIPGAVRDTHLWSYADDGTLELRVNGVVQRHGPLLQ